MKNTYLVILICFITLPSIGQNTTWEQVMGPAPAPQNVAEFSGVSLGCAAFSDVDGDNDIDVVISGINNESVSVCELYSNDGNGNYALVVGTSFTGIYYSSIAFADVDGDNDEDLLITGMKDYTDSISELYINDGTGNFTKVANTPFKGVSNGSIAFSDVDGDGDMDVLITGSHNSKSISELYTNDGNGVFTLTVGTPFQGVTNGAVSFADIDGDNDQDVLITGMTSSNIKISELFINDGEGIYSLVVGTPFTGIDNSTVNFSDIDGDNDKDVLITGTSTQGISELYTNDGAGVYTLIQGTPFKGVEYGAVSFTDVDGDNDNDIIIAGRPSSWSPIAELYTNDGNGSYTLKNSNQFFGCTHGSVIFADTDGDLDKDVLIIGNPGRGLNVGELYSNDGMGNFSFVSGSPFTGVFGSGGGSSVAFADIDGDSDQDVLITGKNIRHPNTHEYVSKLYLNDGSGNFTLVNGTPFPGIGDGVAAFSDVDGDNDQDVIICGNTSNNSNFSNICELYINDGSGNFTVKGTPFTAFGGSCSVTFADVDGDNDQDVMIAGGRDGYSNITELFINDGKGVFTKKTETAFSGIAAGDIVFADIDGDNDLDVNITGSGNVGYLSNLYTNDGTGIFTLISGTPFPAVVGSIAFADIDGDNDQDFFITGSDESKVYHSEMYTNDGLGNFTLMAGTPFKPLGAGGVSFSDVDGDRDKDLFISGSKKIGNANPVVIAELYINDGAGNFTLVNNTPFRQLSESSVAFTDIDGDNLEDLLHTGLSTNTGRSIAYLWRNSSIVMNLSETGTGQEIIAYPNPSNGHVSIQFKRFLSEVEVCIVDIHGKLIRSSKHKNIDGVELNIIQPSGVYFATISTPIGSRVVKLIID